MGAGITVKVTRCQNARGWHGRVPAKGLHSGAQAPVRPKHHRAVTERGRVEAPTRGKLPEVDCHSATKFLNE